VGRKVQLSNQALGAHPPGVPYVTVVNSRWLAVALEKDLTRAVLFDFGAQREGK